MCYPAALSHLPKPLWEDPTLGEKTLIRPEVSDTEAQALVCPGTVTPPDLTKASGLLYINHGSVQYSPSKGLFLSRNDQGLGGQTGNPPRLVSVALTCMPLCGCLSLSKPSYGGTFVSHLSLVSSFTPCSQGSSPGREDSSPSPN